MIYHGTCKHCGAAFAGDYLRGKAPVYCSPDCKMEGRREAGRQRKRAHRAALRLGDQPCRHCGAPRRPESPSAYCSWRCRSQHEASMRKPVHTRICPRCNQTFTTTRGAKRYCSPDCQRTSKALRQNDERRVPKRTKTCPTCGNTFTARSNAHTWCSADCKRSAPKRPRAPKPPSDRRCVVCGARFTTDSRTRKTCSSVCSGRLASLTRGPRTTFTPGAVRTCIECGLDFEQTFQARRRCPSCTRTKKRDEQRSAQRARKRAGSQEPGWSPRCFTLSELNRDLDKVRAEMDAHAQMPGDRYWRAGLHRPIVLTEPLGAD